MSSLIVVHPTFEATWPFVADHLFALWQQQSPAQLIRLEPNDARMTFPCGNQNSSSQIR